MMTPLPAAAPTSDTAVLAVAAAGGDAAAYRQLVRELYPRAYSTAFKILGSRAEAEDAVQTALIKLWREGGRFDPSRGSIEAWFRRLLVNCCIDRRRSLKLVTPLESVAEQPGSGIGPADLAESGDVSARVAQAVERLNVRQRTAIVLFYGEGASMAEIAEVLGSSVKAVEGLLARARVELAAQLDELRS
jgi:RNA polymerase sigma-70 factor (ECF subfamily)